jgi:hypothetical protein
LSLDLEAELDCLCIDGIIYHCTFFPFSYKFTGGQGWQELEGHDSKGMNWDGWDHLTAGVAFFLFYFSSLKLWDYGKLNY